jgi:diguanylate cyclase (GGDEF)-like protein
MDYTTSFVFFLVSLGLFTVALFSLSVVDRTVVGARWLAASTLVDFAKTFLQGLNGYAPRFISVFVANELNIASFVLAFIGLRWFVVRTPFRNWLAMALVVVDMVAYAEMFHRGMRLWSFSVAALPVLAITMALTWMMVQQTDKRFMLPSRLTAAFLGIHTLLLAYRCVLSLHGLSAASTSDPWVNPHWMYSMLGIMLMSYCMLLMYVLFTVVEMHSSIAHAAGVDALTGTLNRRAMMKHAAREMARCQRRERPIAIIAMDLDNFKRVNDTYGHGGGDVALCAFVDLVKEQLRPEDMIARLGGEEFVVILPGMDAIDATLVAEELRCTLERMRIHYDGRMIQTTTSAGVAELQDGDSLAEILKRADAALYRAKSEGRNRVVTDDSIPYLAKPVLVERFGGQRQQSGKTA